MIISAIRSYLLVLPGEVEGHGCRHRGQNVGLHTMPHPVRQIGYDPVFLLNVFVQEDIATDSFTVVISLLAVNFYVKIPVHSVY